MTVAIWKWQTPPDLSPDRADRTILQALESSLGHWDGPVTDGISRSLLQKWFSEGFVKIDGAVARSSQKPKQGAWIEIQVPAAKATVLKPEDIPLDILHDDEHLVILNKQAGLSVHPSNTEESGTLVHALLARYPGILAIGGVERPGIVHRLDKFTSGVMVVAKTQKSHQLLTELFSRHLMERRYWALVYGTLPSSPLRVESLIGRNPNDRTKMSMTVKEGKTAVTHLTTLAHFGNFASWVEAKLETGRTHQVRVHLTGKTCSIMGDPVYGVPSQKQPKWKLIPPEVKPNIVALPGQALHARVLGFKHPITGIPLHFEGEPPEAFQSLLDSLRKYRT